MAASWCTSRLVRDLPHIAARRGAPRRDRLVRVRWPIWGGGSRPSRLTWSLVLARAWRFLAVADGMVGDVSRPGRRRCRATIASPTRLQTREVGQLSLGGGSSNGCSATMAASMARSLAALRGLLTAGARGGGIWLPDRCTRRSAQRSRGTRVLMSHRGWRGAGRGCGLVCATPFWLGDCTGYWGPGSLDDKGSWPGSISSGPGSLLRAADSSPPVTLAGVRVATRGSRQCVRPRPAVLCSWR